MDLETIIFNLELENDRLNDRILELTEENEELKDRIFDIEEQQGEKGWV